MAAINALQAINPATAKKKKKKNPTALPTKNTGGTGGLPSKNSNDSPINTPTKHITGAPDKTDGGPGLYDPNKNGPSVAPDKNDGGPGRVKPDKNGTGGKGDNGGDSGTDLSLVAGKPNKNDPGQVNIADYGSQLAIDPNLGFTKDDPATKDTNESMKLEDHLTSDKDVNKEINNGLINGNDKNLQMDTDKLGVGYNDVSKVAPKDAQGYDVATTQKDVAKEDIDPATGKIKSNDLVTAAQVDIGKIAQGAGLNGDDPEGSVGEALAKYAAVNMSNIIDTSTSAGKLLAQQLGDGNYVDSKATLQGQLEILQSQFVDPVTGEAKIPSWAAGTARNVSKIAAFKGMSGTAATAAMSQALLEASIPIAQADSQFFQTLTLQNLDNRQQSVINTANTLAKFEQTNVDNRMAAAIQNAKSFMDMDMANLSNEQQAKVINNQQRVQSILTDANSKNAERLFQSQTQADMDKFYDSLNTQIATNNSAGNLDAAKFSSTMEDSREKFYKEMQYNVDVANAKWRQEVTLNEDQQQFQASTTDVKNMVDLSVNQLNQIWDRSDALLDYAWKSSESDLNRKNELAKIALTGDYANDSQMMESLGMLAGTFVGSGVGQSLLKNIFGF